MSGEAGIGKSALWEVGVDLARSEGFQVLYARASEGEAQLSFAGLADLLEGVDSAGLAELPVLSGRRSRWRLGGRSRALRRRTP